MLFVLLYLVKTVLLFFLFLRVSSLSPYYGGKLQLLKKLDVGYVKLCFRKKYINCI